MIEQKTWDAHVQKLGGSFLQSWQWGEFQAAVGRPVYRWMNDAAACQWVKHQLPMGRSYAFAPWGPVMGGPEADVSVVKKCILAVQQEWSSSVFLRVEPAEQFNDIKGAKKLSSIHPEWSWVVQLQQPDALMAAMKSKWRYNIRLAGKKGVTVRRTRELNDMEALYELLSATAKRQGIGIHDLSYYLTMVQVLGEAEMLDLYIAEYEGKVIAGAIMVGYGDTYTYVHGGANHEYRSVMAPHAVQWAGMEYAQAQGYAVYDFFGAAKPEHDKTHPWAGITRFKQGFGGEYVQRSGTWEIPLNSMWYTVYTIGKRLRRG